MVEKQTDIVTQAAEKFHNQGMHIFHTESVYTSGEKDHTHQGNVTPIYIQMQKREEHMESRGDQKYKFKNTF